MLLNQTQQNQFEIEDITPKIQKMLRLSLILIAKHAHASTYIYFTANDNNYPNNIA